MSVALLTGCKLGSKDTPAVEVLAEVNGQPITETTFRHWWLQRQPAVDNPQTRQALLEDLIARAALVQQASAAGLDADPVVIEQIENLLIRRLEETRLQPKIAAVQVDPVEVQAYYLENLETKFTQPTQRRLAVLWFQTRGQAPLAARYRPRLEQARSMILRDPAGYPVEQGFGPLAIQYSEHRASRYKGGDLGWLEPSASPGFPSTVFRIGEQLTEAGDISPVVEMEEGLFVVRLIDEHPSRAIDLATVEPEIRRKLRRQKQQHMEQEFRESIRRQASVIPYPEHLTSLDALESGATLSAADGPDAPVLVTPEVPNP